MVCGARQAALISPDGSWSQEFDGLFAFCFVGNLFDRLGSCLRIFQRAPAADAAEAQRRRILCLDRLMDSLEDPRTAHKQLAPNAKIRGNALPMSTPGLPLDHCAFLGRFEQCERNDRRLARFGYRFEA